MDDKDTNIAGNEIRDMRRRWTNLISASATITDSFIKAWRRKSPPPSVVESSDDSTLVPGCPPRAFVHSCFLQLFGCSAGNLQSIKLTFVPLFFRAPRDGGSGTKPLKWGSLPCVEFSRVTVPPRRADPGSLKPGSRHPPDAGPLPASVESVRLSAASLSGSKPRTDRLPSAS